jgi:hypothetical protein
MDGARRVRTIPVRNSRATPALTCSSIIVADCKAIASVGSSMRPSFMRCCMSVRYCVRRMRRVRSASPGVIGTVYRETVTSPAASRNGASQPGERLGGASPIRMLRV